MLGTILEVAQNEKSLSIQRGSIYISEQGKECGRVPISNIEAVIISAHKSFFTRPFLVSLAEHNIPLIVCDNKYQPISITNAYASHSESGKRFRAQAGASKPLNKNLWKVIIKEKIANQAQVLLYHKPEHNYCNKIKLLSKAVLSGDSSRKEGQAARLYWRALFGNNFIRDIDAENENILLNYCYIVLRTAMIRSILGAGLHPALGVFHRHPLNAHTLADDLMEPLRPLADHLVYNLLNSNNGKIEELNPEIKRKLASILTVTVLFEKTETPLYQALHHMALSLAKTYLGGKLCIKFPKIDLTRLT